MHNTTHDTRPTIKALVSRHKRMRVRRRGMDHASKYCVPDVAVACRGGLVDTSRSTSPEHFERFVCKLMGVLVGVKPKSELVECLPYLHCACCRVDS
eukprot:scaffold114276_cov31-Tisochrysis_lutea.AAC.2